MIGMPTADEEIWSDQPKSERIPGTGTIGSGVYIPSLSIVKAIAYHRCSVAVTGKGSVPRDEAARAMRNKHPRGKEQLTFFAKACVRRRC